MSERSVRTKWIKREFVLLMLMICVMAIPVQAAKLSKPTLSVYSACEGGKIVLRYSGVPGAKKYEVYRSSRKSGGYKKWGTTKATTFIKKGSGYYYYKVRAVNRKKKSSYSRPIHIYAAIGRITNDATDGIRVLVTNKGGKPMNFLRGNYGYLYLVQRGTDKVVARTTTYLYSDGVGKRVGKGKTASIYYAPVNMAILSAYRANPSQYELLATMSFYPGKGSNIAVSYGLAAGEGNARSSIAGRF